MRPTIARMSGMPGPKTYLSWWGDTNGVAVKQRGIIQYTISPSQGKVIPKLFRTYLFNGYRRLSGEALFFVIPFLAGFSVYSWAKSYDAWQNSKAAHGLVDH